MPHRHGIAHAGWSPNDKYLIAHCRRVGIAQLGYDGFGRNPFHLEERHIGGGIRGKAPGRG